jgi:hypothetical protein
MEDDPHPILIYSFECVTIIFPHSFPIILTIYNTKIEIANVYKYRLISKRCGC